MQRSMGGKRTRRRDWILRGALATLGLAGAVYAADQATAPPAPDDLEQTIANQRVREGEPAKPAADFEHQAHKLSSEQMISLVERYGTESKTAYDHAETTRISVYRPRDIIRMTCVDDKLTQMKEILIVSEQRRLLFPRLASEELKMRQHYLVLQQARNRVMELAAEVEACLGDTLDSVSLGRLKEEKPAIDQIFDPTRPPTPTHDIDRPAEASPYR